MTDIKSDEELVHTLEEAADAYADSFGRPGGPLSLELDDARSAVLARIAQLRADLLAMSSIDERASRCARCGEVDSMRICGSCVGDMAGEFAKAELEAARAETRTLRAQLDEANAALQARDL